MNIEGLKEIYSKYSETIFNKNEVFSKVSYSLEQALVDAYNLALKDATSLDDTEEEE